MPTTTSPASDPGLAKRPPPRELTLGGFDEHNENLHGVEFEAPFSSALQKPPLTKGRFSIDFSIDLERQLERMETSPPSSPPAGVGGDHSITEGQSYDHDGDVTSDGQVDKELLDPDILAHLVMQLRHSLSEMTKERDELVKMLAHVNAEEANVKDALQLMTEKATQAEEELGEAKRRMKEDEEQIALLRAKVDESRRGLMRLQTESRRQSMAPLDLSRASSLAVASFGNPPSAKRASFAPLTGSRPGRIPPVADNNLVSPDHNSSPPHSHGSFGDVGLSPNASRRFSGLFGRVSPVPDTESDVQPPHAEIETLKQEVKSLKSELESVKHELAEANEAKEASETCVVALREFIAENNNIGAMAVKLPPPPTMASCAQDATAAAEPKKSGSGWGFKLWATSNSGPTSAIHGGVVDPHGAAATPPPMSPAPSGTYGVPPTPVTAVPIPTPPAPAPLSRKLTGLFSSRSSISSRGSSVQAKSQLGSTGTSSSPFIDRTNSTYSYSDVSSVAELTSPVMVNCGLGVLKPVGEDRVAGADVTHLDLVDRHGGFVGGIEKGQDEVDLDGELK